MNHKMFCGREINVLPAAEKWKRPEDIHRRTGHSDYKGHHLSRHGRSRSRSCSPRRGGRDRSRNSVHVHRWSASTDGEGSCPHQRPPRPSSGSHSRRRDGYFASPKGKEEHQEQSPRHSKEYDKCKKQRSDTRDNSNSRRDSDCSHNEKRALPDTISLKRTEEPREAKSQSQSNEHDNKKKRSYTCDYRKNSCSADSGSKERRNDYSASGNKKEDRKANLPGQSKYHDENKKRGSFTPDDRNDHHDTDNGSKERRDDNSAPRVSGSAAPQLMWLPPPSHTGSLAHSLPPPRHSGSLARSLPPPRHSGSLARSLSPPRHTGSAALRLPSQDQPELHFTGGCWDQLALRPNEDKLRVPSGEEEVKFALRLPPPRHSGLAPLKLPSPDHPLCSTDDHWFFWGQPPPVQPALYPSACELRISSGEEEETFDVCLNIDDIVVEDEQIPCWSPHNSDYSKSDSPQSDPPSCEKMSAMVKEQLSEIMKKNKEKEERKRKRKRQERKRKRQEEERKRKRKRKREERKRKRKRDEEMETKREKKRRSIGRY